MAERGKVLGLKAMQNTKYFKTGNIFDQNPWWFNIRKTDRIEWFPCSA
jgi:hypothetical protein